MLLEPDDHYLEQVAELAKQHGTLLIFDEVITGFRRDIRGAQSYYNVTPDLADVGQGHRWRAAPERNCGPGRNPGNDV